MSSKNKSYNENGFEVVDHPEGGKAVMIYAVTDEKGIPLGFPDSQFPECDVAFFKEAAFCEHYIKGFSQGIFLARDRVRAGDNKKAADRIAPGLFMLGVRGVAVSEEDALEIMSLQEDSEEGGRGVLRIGNRDKGLTESERKAVLSLFGEMKKAFEQDDTEEEEAGYEKSNDSNGGGVDIDELSSALLDEIEKARNKGDKEV